MEAMGPILLLAGVLAIVYGGASFSRTRVASGSRMRDHSRAYAGTTLTVGVVLAVAGIALLLA